MRYKFLKAITDEVEIGDKVATPVVGYLMEDLLTGTTFQCDRKKGYDLVNADGAVNVVAKTRKVSCEQDKPDDEGIIYYLRLTDGTKINEHLISKTEIKL